jgi:hypothetical protein
MSLLQLTSFSLWRRRAGAAARARRYAPLATVRRYRYYYYSSCAPVRLCAYYCARCCRRVVGRTLLLAAALSRLHAGAVFGVFGVIHISYIHSCLYVRVRKPLCGFSRDAWPPQGGGPVQHLKTKLAVFQACRADILSGI